MKLSEYEKAYIAGFLDGDGCIMFQLVRRKDYIYGYQIRASVVFYQKKVHIQHLQWIYHKLKYGYVRIRKDDMAEYTIVGIRPVIEVLTQLRPYVRLKKKHIDVAFRIAKQLPRYTRLDQKLLLKVSRLVDQYAELNYSKRRSNTSKKLHAFLKQRVPRND